MTEPVVLRPHHSLCIQFFEGKGYSPQFVDGMTKTIKMLEQNDPEVVLTRNCDNICRNCPENQQGLCRFDDKVNRIDRACLEALDKTFGVELHWSELAKAAKMITENASLMKRICGDCSWRGICLKQQTF